MRTRRAEVGSDVLPRSEIRDRPQHDVRRDRHPYDEAVLPDVTEYLTVQMRRRQALIPAGYSWTFVVMTYVTVAVIMSVATAQRPHHELPITLCAAALAWLPQAVFFIQWPRVSGGRFTAAVTNGPACPIVLTSTSLLATAAMLFGTSTPIPDDVAPLLLALTAGVAGAYATRLVALIGTAASAALLLTAAATHRLDNVLLYLSCLGMGWLVGYLMGSQQQLLLAQARAQVQLAEAAASDERRRIAREVHDVIAHSLSVTLLHVTGARRALQQDRDVDEAVDALCDAEQQGRQAMADIRRTVGLLDSTPTPLSPTPDVHDIADLVDDFVRAGMTVDLDVRGDTKRVSPAAGLALYRIAQESLANVAKHAPDTKSFLTLNVSRISAKLTVSNDLPVAVLAHASADGRGLPGMRQRTDLLGGVLEAGPSPRGWTVAAEIPHGDSTCPIRGR